MTRTLTQWLATVDTYFLLQENGKFWRLSFLHYLMAACVNDVAKSTSACHLLTGAAQLAAWLTLPPLQPLIANFKWCPLVGGGGVCTQCSKHRQALVSRKAQYGPEHPWPCLARLKALRTLWLAIEEWRVFSNSYRTCIRLVAVGKSIQLRTEPCTSERAVSLIVV
jgi:hypothetical protein